MKSVFRKFSERVAVAVGTPWAFIAAIAVIAVWGATGPAFGFSTHWQLVVNSITTIVTFLMVFVIQNTQERDFKSLQIKLDALLRAADAPDGLVAVQEFSDEDLERLEEAFRRLRGTPKVGELVRAIEAGRRGPYQATRPSDQPN